MDSVLGFDTSWLAGTSESKFGILIVTCQNRDSYRKAFCKSFISFKRFSTISKMVRNVSLIGTLANSVSAGKIRMSNEMFRFEYVADRKPLIEVSVGDSLYCFL